LLATNEKDELIELSCDGNLQKMFDKTDLTEFWLGRQKGYRLTFNKAVKFLLVFSATYLYECGFSSMIDIKINTGID
jgi:hypothetical protein